MHVLITNTTLGGGTGLELWVLDLVRGLLRRGHRVGVASPVHGPLAEEVAAAGAEVVASARELSAPPDVLHGHAHAVTVEALLAFPSVPALFVCHDRLAAAAVPPLHPRVRRYVAGDSSCEERLRLYGIPDGRRAVVPDGVDLSRLPPRAALPQRPARALAFADAGALPDVEPLRAACAAGGVALEAATRGASGDGEPGRLLSGYDLVFAEGRCALEALAVGCAVVLFGRRGLGEAVSFASVPRMRAWGFGPPLPARSPEAASVLAELARYDRDDAAAVRDVVRREADAAVALDRYEALYGEVLEEPPAPGCAEEELRRYLDLQLRAALDVADRPSACATEPLAASALGALEISWSRRPERVRAGERFEARVTLANRGSGRVSSDPPWPVHLSYRWFDRDSGEVVVLDGARSLVLPPLALDERRSYPVGVEAPARPGSYRLLVTLVQEGVAWLSDRAAHLGLSADVEVEAPTAPEAS